MFEILYQCKFMRLAVLNRRDIDEIHIIDGDYNVLERLPYSVFPPTQEELLRAFSQAVRTYAGNDYKTANAERDEIYNFMMSETYQMAGVFED